jgi:hypothetical protein
MIRYGSSGRVISPTQTPLSGNTQHSQQADVHAAGGIQTHSLSKRRSQTHVLGYGYIVARTDTTQHSGQTPDKEGEIKNITVYVSGYNETDTTGMLSPLTVWRFSVAADIVTNVFDFYFLILSLVPDCCVVSVLASM